MTPRAFASGGQRRDPVAHAPGLERTGRLEVLRLEVQPVVGDVTATGRLDPARGGVRREHRCPLDETGDPLAGGFDLGERDLRDGIG